MPTKKPGKVAHVEGQATVGVQCGGPFPDPRRAHVEAAVGLVPLALHQLGRQVADLVVRLGLLDGKVAPVVAEDVALAA